jgi:opacity protein-like surface antigen
MPVQLMPERLLHALGNIMDSIMRSIFLPGLVAIVLAYPDIALTQTEASPSTSPSPASASSRAPATTAGTGEWWERLGFGGKLGMSLSTFVGEDAAAEYAHRPWPTIGGLIKVELLHWLALQPEVLFVSKGADVELDGVVTDTFDGRYIELPLLARITIPLGEQVNPYLLAGPTLGALLSFNLEDREDGSVTDRTDTAKSIDLGLLGGIGVEIMLSRQHALVLEGRYDRSLATIAKDETEDFKNSVFAFMLGYQYSLSSTP